VFPSVFFPNQSKLDGALLSFVVFSFAFIARPFGNAIFMAIQARWGRGVKLTGALFLLGISTAGMAFLPGHATLGFAAIVLLSVLRFTQGLAIGGSWDGLPSLLALNAPESRRGWYAMLGQLGAPIGFIIASSLFWYLHASLEDADFLSWGWRYPFYVAFALNVVALFARLRLVMTEEYTELLEERELEPIGVAEMLRTQSSHIAIGAFASLASYALFHLVTVFPLSWIILTSTRPINEVLGVELLGAVLSIGATVMSGLIADNMGRRKTLGMSATLIGVFALAAPWLLDGGPRGQDAFIILGFVLLGLSYGQAAGAVSANFPPRCRYTGAALTSDFAWLIGAAFAPLVALGLSAKFGLGYLSVYLLSGVICTLVALRINRMLGTRT
jgi:MFS family permease